MQSQIRKEEMSINILRNNQGKMSKLSHKKGDDINSNEKEANQEEEPEHPQRSLQAVLRLFYSYEYRDNIWWKRNTKI